MFPEEQGARIENYYLIGQRYLPLLNTTFYSSSIFFPLEEASAIYANLTSKLATLRSTQDSFTSGQSIPIYAYEVKDRYINKTYVKYDSITEARNSLGLQRNSWTLAIFRDTNVPLILE